MKKLAIIPARGGSKRIPQKNVRPFLGKPIISYSIRAALKSALFDEIMVSTDDRTIGEIGIRYGAEVPFLRSEVNANDYASTTEVLHEVINAYRQQDKWFQYACCIYPASPLISVNRLIEGFEMLVEGKFDTVFPVIPYGHPIQRALTFDNDHIRMIEPENADVRSQDLSPAFHDAGQFYWIDTEAFMTSGKIWTENAGAIVISEMEAQDIDTVEDWSLAELKFKLKQRLP